MTSLNANIAERLGDTEVGSFYDGLVKGLWVDWDEVLGNYGTFRITVEKEANGGYRVVDRDPDFEVDISPPKTATQITPPSQLNLCLAPPPPLHFYFGAISSIPCPRAAAQLAMRIHAAMRIYIERQLVLELCRVALNEHSVAHLSPMCTLGNHTFASILYVTRCKKLGSRYQFTVEMRGWCAMLRYQLGMATPPTWTELLPSNSRHELVT